MYIEPKDEHLTLFARSGVLLVTRPPFQPPRPAPRQLGVISDYVQPYPDILIAVYDDSSVKAFCGHVDLGTGIRTALGQMVADELDIPFERVTIELGHTAATPDQGPTVASATLQISATPIRRAAALAREYLLGQAALWWSCSPSSLSVHDGMVIAPGGELASYGELIDRQHIELPLRDDVMLKSAAQHRIIGREVPRIDLPQKATGGGLFVHDVRVPGMWHGRVARPPYTGRDTGDFIGKSLIAVDYASVRRVSELAEVVVIGDFVGVAAPSEAEADAALEALVVKWADPPPLIDLQDIDSALSSLPHQERVLNETGDCATHEAVISFDHVYTWPYQMHASIGPSCAVADYSAAAIRIWSGTQNPHWLRADLARLISQDEGLIEIIRLEAAGCYGRNCADDVCADALLLSRALGRPVRVQLTRQQEHGWDPKGAAQRIQVKAAIDASGSLCAYELNVRYPANDAPNLGLLLTGVQPAAPRMLEIGDRTAIPPYSYPNQRIVCHDVAPVVRASWLRGVSAMPNSFAHDCMIDELAEAAGEDQVAYRVKHLPDERAQALVLETAARAGWRSDARGSRGKADSEGWLRGRGVSYAQYIHSKFPGFPSSWACWVIDLSVHEQTGRVRVDSVVVGQDSGMIVNPAGVRHQIHGNVIQSISRVLKEAVHFDGRGVVDFEWGAYPIIDFTEVPHIEVVLMDRQNEPPMGSGESASVPSGAAIANALYDATGVRFRDVPFTSDKIRRSLSIFRPSEEFAE